MSQSRVLSRTVLSALVVAPVSLIGILSVNVLLPALNNPESKFYSSNLGYPAVQRLVGKPIKVETVLVKSKTLENSVAAPGESVALQEIEIRPQVSGLVEKVYVAEGQQVRRGQVLLQLQKSSFLNAVDAARNDVAIAEINLKALEKTASEQLAMLKANVESAKARLAIAETKFKQINSIAETGAISKLQVYNNQDIYANSQNVLFTAQQNLLITKNRLNSQIEQARLTLENKKIALQKAQRDSNYTTIYASNDGLVSQVNIHSGELADTRSSIPLVVLNKDVVFKAYIDQARLNSVKLGNFATVRLVAYPGRVYQGQVTRINPTVETNVTKPGKVGINRQYTYSAWVTVKGLQMPPGLQGYVQLKQGKTSLVIPESAVTHLSGGESMVMVAEADKAVVKRVKLGKLFDNQREVLEGLKPGEKVIPNARALNPGDQIEANVVQK